MQSRSRFLVIGIIAFGAELQLHAQQPQETIAPATAGQFQGGTPGTSPLCPAPTPHAMDWSSAELAVVVGHVARLESVQRQFLMSDLETKVEIRGLLFRGGRQGSYVVPTEGKVNSISINGRNLQLITGKIEAGCVDVQDLGPILLLLRPNMPNTSSDFVTILLGPEQLKLVRNADIEARDGYGLFVAAANGSANTVKTLLANTAHVNAHGKGGLTPLHAAALYGYPDVAKLLLDAKADIEAKDDAGRTPLFVAVARNFTFGIFTEQVDAKPGHKGVVKLLLANMAALNARDNHGITPLLAATAEGDAEMVELLLSSEAADVNARDRNGITPLLAATANGDQDILKLLMSHGADVNASDNAGYTPLHLAAATCHKDAAELLLIGHANVWATDKDSQTPWQVASSVGHQDLAELLSRTPTSAVLVLMAVNQFFASHYRSLWGMGIAAVILSFLYFYPRWRGKRPAASTGDGTCRSLGGGKRQNAQKFAYVAIVAALALIVFFPPSHSDVSLRISRSWQSPLDTPLYGPPMMKSIRWEGLIWFAPIISVRNGNVVTRLWWAEFAVWGCLSAALLVLARRTEFSGRVAMFVLICALIASIAIPTKTLGYRSHPNGWDVYSCEIGVATVEEEDDTSGSFHEIGNASAIQSLKAAWNGPPKFAVGEYMVDSIPSGRTGPAVFATWIGGIFLACFAGLLAKKNKT